MRIFLSPTGSFTGDAFSCPFAIAFQNMGGGAAVPCSFGRRGQDDSAWPHTASFNNGHSRATSALSAHGGRQPQGVSRRRYCPCSPTRWCWMATGDQAVPPRLPST